jgi:hypothetical protein
MNALYFTILFLPSAVRPKPLFGPGMSSVDLLKILPWELVSMIVLIMIPRLLGTGQ